MKLIDFMGDFDGAGVVQFPVHVFHGAEYQPLFCSFLLDKIRVATGRSITRLDISLQSNLEFEAHIATSFLGLSRLIWLSDFSAIGSSKQAEVMEQVNKYTGPHTLFFFSFSEAIGKISSSIPCIEIPKVVDQHLFEAMGKLVHRMSINQSILKWLAGTYKGVTIDKAYILLQHARMLDTSKTTELQALLDPIAQSETSLFLLSQYFFARQAELFFNTWYAMEGAYSFAFWTTFWSEQLWQAYHYVSLSNQKQFDRARAVAYRLPFSFFKSDYKKHELRELQRAHDFVYKIDCALKKGSTFSAHFDLFFSKFFSGTFV